MLKWFVTFEVKEIFLLYNIPYEFIQYKIIYTLKFKTFYFISMLQLDKKLSY